MNLTTELTEGLSPKEANFAQMFLVGLQEVLGSKLHGLYLYGASMFPHPSTWRVDFDFHAILTQVLSEPEKISMRSLYANLRKKDSLGEELDGYCILLESARQRDYPSDQVSENVVDSAWALHRAHIHAGRFTSLYGEDPRRFLLLPEWSELETGLDNEFEFIVGHPQYPQFGILNLSRILYSYEHRDVVTSKYESAQWALGTLESKWHPAIQAALRDYEQRLEPDDIKFLKESFPIFLTFATGEIERLKTGLRS